MFVPLTIIKLVTSARPSDYAKIFFLWPAGIWVLYCLAEAYLLPVFVVAAWYKATLDRLWAMIILVTSAGNAKEFSKHFGACYKNSDGDYLGAFLCAFFFKKADQ